MRVTVDIARRYWTVYRYDVPTFPGQLPDKTATQKLAAERIEAAEKSPGVESFQTPLLYKKACIVVSWSRYMAVSVLYGPPAARMVQNYKDAMAEIEREEEEKSLQRSRSRTKSADTTPNSEMSGELKVSASISEEADDAEFYGDGETPGLESVELEKTTEPEAVPIEFAPQRLFSDNPCLAEEKKVPLRKTIRKWIKKKSATIREQYLTTDKRNTLVDPSEGIMHLEKPLLLCQEIYTRIIGNHQTSLVTKEEVLELLQQDNKQHKEDAETDADDTYTPLSNADDSENGEVEVDADGAVFLDDDHLFTVGGSDDFPSPASYDDDEEVSSGALSSTAAVKDAPGSPESAVSEHKDSVLDDDEDDAEEEIIRVPEEDQPLVGYWLWENTLRTHKIKMHVAKGTDLALHVVLAIITNQVRYERNAIAMTI